MDNREKKGITLVSEAPFENAMEALDKGYIILGGAGFLLGVIRAGFTAGIWLLLIGLFLWWVVKANIALIKWKKLRFYKFNVEEQISYEELLGKLVAALTPYGLRVDSSQNMPSICYKNVRIKVMYNADETFSMPWSQNAGMFFFDFRYILSYHNTVAIMSIVGYHVQNICSMETEEKLQTSVPDSDQESKKDFQINGSGDISSKRYKEKKKLSQIVVAVIAVIGIVTVIPVFKGSKYIDFVKQSSPWAYPDITYGEAFESFFDKTKWKYFKSENEEDIVEFSGECTYQEAKVTATLQFILSYAEGTFETGYFGMNGVPQNGLMTFAIISKVFEEYSSPNESHELTRISENTVGAVTSEAAEAVEDEALLGYFAENDWETEENSSDTSEFIISDSNTRRLTDEEIFTLSSDELRIATNEIYARHGRKFKDASLQEYFNSKSWYQGLIEPDQFDEGLLNEIEKGNAAKLSSKQSKTFEPEFEAGWIYGTYECHSEFLDATLEVGWSSGDDIDCIYLIGSSIDGASFGEFAGDVVSSNNCNYTAVDADGNIINFYYNGIDSIDISDDNDLLGGSYFPGFGGTYYKAEDLSHDVS